MEVKKRTISADKEMKVLKMKVKVGTMIYDGRVLLIYEEINNVTEGNRQKKLKSSEVGVVKGISIKEGDIVKPGSVILELEKECNHPTVIKDLCAECGADLQKENAKDGGPTTQASVSMVHMVPELKVNDELAQILGKADMERLLENRKLVLLVDLDQTLIHTTNDNIPNNIKDVCHFQLYGSRSPWYHTRLRPGTHNFLQGVSEKYELHICTFGSRRYAHMIAGFLDPDGKFFSHRILSRDECFDPNSKTANLKALFPCGENMVCIIDDREDVWEYASNLIHVKPYHFFQHTGDIHAPPGLTKCENDKNEDGFDFSRLNNGISNETENEKDSSDKSDDQGIDDEREIVSDIKDDKSAELPDETLEENIKTGSANENTGPEHKTEIELSADSKCEAKIDSSSELNKNVEVESKLSSNKLESKNVAEKDDPTKVDDGNHPSSSHLSTEAEAEAADSPSETSSAEPPALTSIMPDTITVTAQVPRESSNVTNDENVPVVDGSVSSSPSESERPNGASAGGPVTSAEARTSMSRLDADGFIVIEETDDYLLYLEEILKVIHAEFFRLREKTGRMPDLKQVIPETRAKVLQGVSLAFSGIVPNRMRLEESQAYRIARSLGAKVTQNIEPDTTHLVALRAGTAKVHAANKRKNLKLVTPDWLWTCAERWEKVDERLFPLKNAKLNADARHPPAHCRSPEHPEPSLFTFPSAVGGGAASSGTAEATPNKFSASSSSPPQVGGFMYTINPLMSLSSEDIETMEGEVEDIFKESDGEADDPFGGAIDDDGDDVKDSASSCRKRKLSKDSSSSDEDIRINERERRGKKKLKSAKIERNASFTANDMDCEDYGYCDEDEDEDDDDDYDGEENRKRSTSDSEEDDETLNAKFRRGEGLPSDLDLEYNSEEGTEEERESDGEWNVMGAALEREFLEGE